MLVAAAAVQEQDRAGRTPRPMTLVTSSSEPPFREVTTPGGVFTNDTVLSPPVGVLNVSESSPSEAIGTSTTPLMPVVGPGVLNVTKFLLAISVVSNVGGGTNGVLANSRVWKPHDHRSVGGAERLVVSEVVEGVVDRRRRVGDRQEAGVIEAREARERSLAVVEEDRAVLADLREDAVIVGVVGLACERAGGQRAEDVEGVAVGGGGPEVSAGIEDQTRRVHERDRVAAAHVDVHHLVAEGAGVDRQRADVAGDVGDVSRSKSGQSAIWRGARQGEVVADRVGRGINRDVGEPERVGDQDRTQDSRQAAEVADQDGILSGLAVDRERTVRGCRQRRRSYRRRSRCSGL